ncbi:MAG: alpha/beta hydrolase [Armatimonadetes bacterium]|nr:alpha/beta hydrolase [Armatimonadota bacterium]MDW8121357.1 alpha/beta hydrolase [Armatimonadota bacterium]
MVRADWIGVWWESVAAGLQESLLRRVRWRAPQPFTTVKDIVYSRVQNRNLTLDLYLPKDAHSQTPILLAVHGGAWSMGSKAGVQWIGWLMASRGWAVVCPNYRLAPKFKFPAPVDDLCRSVEWIHRSIGEWGMEPHYVCAFGISAGAHLALLVGLKDRPSPFSKILAIFPPTDLTAPYYVEAARNPPPFMPNFLKDFLGCTYEEGPELWRQASPISYIHPKAPPCFLIQGTKDRLVPADQAVRFAQALTKVGGQVHLRLVDGMGHGISLKPAVIRELRRVLLEALDFLQPQPSRSLIPS